MNTNHSMMETFSSWVAFVIDVIYTPGHTPNSITLAITDKARGDSPEIILTGDLLFVGSVGRPDLAGGELLDEQISNEYASLHEKLGKLPDLVEVYPAHGAGSLCGAGLSAKPSSTLGFERAAGPHFQLSFDQFKAELTRTTPVRPKNFSYIIDQNQKGPILLKDLPPVEHYDVNALKQFIEAGKTLIDLRDASSFGGHMFPEVSISVYLPRWLTGLGRLWILKGSWCSWGARKVISMKRSCSLDDRVLIESWDILLGLQSGLPTVRKREPCPSFPFTALKG